MPILLIRHHVKDFAVWQRVFGEEASIRRANGARRERLLRTAAAPNELWLLLEWDDLFRAELYVQSDDLRDALERAGVTDHPDYWYLTED